MKLHDATVQKAVISYCCCENLKSYVDYMLDDQGLISGWAEIFIFVTTCCPAQSLTQAPVKWIPGVKYVRYKADQ
jgi:hypothetical protein